MEHPKEHRAKFPSAASILHSYALRLPAVEINSSFYRSHQAKTYLRWAASVPEAFRFAVKLGREFTHEARLQLDCATISQLGQVLKDYQALGVKLGCLLIQLPPSLEWNAAVARAFLTVVRSHYVGAVALEPRHSSWTQPSIREVLRDFKVSRVWANPAPIANPEASDFSDGGVAYFRLHGSPEIYKSNYESDQLKGYLAQAQAAAKIVAQTWCIFDNTTYGFATANALEITR